MAGIGDFMGMMGKLKDIQTNMQQMQEDMRNKTFEADSGGGMVTVKINGKGDLLDMKIDPKIVDPNDIELLEDLIKAAVNTATAKSQQAMKDQFSQMAAGMNIPGLDKIGGMLGIG